MTMKMLFLPEREAKVAVRALLDSGANHLDPIRPDMSGKHV